MKNSITTNVIRCLLVFLIQVLIFKQITFPLGNVANIHFIIYPIAILLMPIKTPRPILLVVAFIFGICLDFFYDSVGIHAATFVFTAYIRNIIIAFLEPFNGYNIDDVPSINTFGLGWFVSYIMSSFLIHIFVYFCIDAFSFVFFFEIFLNTIFSFFVSFMVVIVFQFIFRSKY